MRRLFLIILLFFFQSKIFANDIYFEDGKSFFDQKNFQKAKFKFEQDIVFNPKKERSYLYLAKIYQNEKKNDLAEMNLNTVLLINPKNEEAIFNLMKLQIKKSNFSELNKNFEIFKKVCKNLCFRSSEISKELKNSKK